MAFIYPLQNNSWSFSNELRRNFQHDKHKQTIQTAFALTALTELAESKVEIRFEWQVLSVLSKATKKVDEIEGRLERSSEVRRVTSTNY